mgnify:CR=1 FL=1|jgi:copper(I)-binding protein|tara:strand:- start:9562 stop:9990 length:429 start_codon:yes stop_codon:yes gene_type:complete
MRLLSTFLLALLLTACDQQAEGFFIEKSWIREAPPNARALAGYMLLNNNTAKDVTLVSAQSDDFAVVQFHRSIEEDGVYRMQHYPQLTVAAGETIEFKPADFHLMLMSPKRALTLGDTVTVQVTLSDQTVVLLNIPVQKKAP